MVIGQPQLREDSYDIPLVPDFDRRFTRPREARGERCMLGFAGSVGKFREGYARTTRRRTASRACNFEMAKHRPGTLARADNAGCDQR